VRSPREVRGRVDAVLHAEYGRAVARQYSSVSSRLRGSGVRVADLLDVVASEVHDPGVALQNAFAWRFERVMSTVRALVGLAATLAAGLLVALTSEHGLENWQVLAWSASVIIAAAAAWLYQRRHRWLAGEYLQTLTLLADLQAIGSFLRLVREAT